MINNTIWHHKHLLVACIPRRITPWILAQRLFCACKKVTKKVMRGWFSGAPRSQTPWAGPESFFTLPPNDPKRGFILNGRILLLAGKYVALCVCEMTSKNDLKNSKIRGKFREKILKFFWKNLERKKFLPISFVNTCSVLEKHRRIRNEFFYTNLYPLGRLSGNFQVSSSREFQPATSSEFLNFGHDRLIPNAGSFVSTAFVRVYWFNMQMRTRGAPCEIWKS